MNWRTCALIEMPIVFCWNLSHAHQLHACAVVRLRDPLRSIDLHFDRVCVSGADHLCAGDGSVITRPRQSDAPLWNRLDHLGLCGGGRRRCQQFIPIIKIFRQSIWRITVLRRTWVLT